MTSVIERPDLGGFATKKREYFQQREVVQLGEAISRRPMTASGLNVIARRSRDVLGSASWFAKDSRLLLDCALLHGQAMLGYLSLATSPPDSRVPVVLGDATVTVAVAPPPEAKDVTNWINAWCSALSARDEATLAGLSRLDDDIHRAASARVDEYQYAWKRAVRALVLSQDECAAALEEARRLWTQRSVAEPAASAIHAFAFDLVDAISRQDGDRCNQSLGMVLDAHRSFWSRGDEYLSSLGWVALQPLGLACLAYDRGISIEVESDYLPLHLIARQFGSPSPLRLPHDERRELTVRGASAQSATAIVARLEPVARFAAIGRDIVAKERAIAQLAGETFARVRLEPDGYVRIPLERAPLAGFDFVYEKSNTDIVLVDTFAANQQLEIIEVGEREVVQGTRAYVLYVVDRMRRFAPALAARISASLCGGSLRYFEVRRPINESGELGEIEIRQFALN